MKKVIAVLPDNHYCLTTVETATKNRWYVAYLVTVVKEDTIRPNYMDEHKLPTVGTVMSGIGGRNYRISEIKPSHVCAICNNTGRNRILKMFYCDEDYKKLVITRPIKNTGKVPGRNEPCHCGSNLKYKNCCMAKDAHKPRHYFNSNYKQGELLNPYRVN
jgi:hypothetical protein